MARTRTRRAAYLAGVLVLLTLVVGLTPSRSSHTAPTLSDGIDDASDTRLLWTLPDDGMNDLSRQKHVSDPSIAPATVSKPSSQRSIATTRLFARIPFHHPTFRQLASAVSRAGDTTSADPH